MEQVKLFTEVEYVLQCFVDQSVITRSSFSSGTLCFFPGSFNPWHEGHSHCVEQHLKSFPHIPLMILPDINPQKNVHGQEHHYRGLPHTPQVRISHVFKTLNTGNPTFAWVEFLKQHVKDLRIGLLMGLDSFIQIPTWIQSHLLLQNIDFLEVVDRKINYLDFNISSVIMDYQKINPQLKVHFLQDNPYKDLSSSLLRQKRVPKS